MLVEVESLFSLFVVVGCRCLRYLIDNDNFNYYYCYSKKEGENKKKKNFLWARKLMNTHIHVRRKERIRSECIKSGARCEGDDEHSQ